VTKRDVMEVAVKVFGIFMLILFVRALPMTVVQFFIDTSEFISNRMAYLVFNIVHSFTPLVFACLFLFRGKAIASFLVADASPETDTGGTQPAYAQIWFWVVIIGLYYFVSSASALIAQLLAHTIEFTEFPMTLTGQRFWSSIIALLLSIFFIFWSKPIDRFIQKRTGGTRKGE